MVSLVALIPARSGSKRVANKNIRLLAGHPLMAYTISAARNSGVFSAVVVSTDSADYADIAAHYGAEVPFLRPLAMAAATSPDIDWVQHALGELAAAGRVFDAFSILRPTSPFRQPETIRRAHQAFLADPAADSLRAIEPCGQHPGKMWQIEGEGARMRPYAEGAVGGVPWHSCQMAALPPVYVQNASLEMAWVRTAMEKGSIAGTALIPFLTEGAEGFDINQPEDWIVAEHLLASGAATLPKIDAQPMALRRVIETA